MKTDWRNIPVIFLLVQGACIVGLVWQFGMPLNFMSWVLLVVLWPALIVSCIRIRRWQFLLLACVFATYMALPYLYAVMPIFYPRVLFDSAGVRKGIYIPPFMEFGKSTKTTRVLEGYIGPIEASWSHHYYISNYIRDGNERVKSRIVTRFDFFPDILAMLPDDKARRGVITSLIDVDNRLRFHQGLLLGCIVQFGYPQGLDAQTWWAKHRHLFYSENNAYKAAALTFNWTIEVNKLTEDLSYPSIISPLQTAASYQDRGGWGAHPGFYEFYDDYYQEKVGSLDIPLGGNVVWWETK